MIKSEILGYIPEGKRELCSKWDKHFIEQCLHIAKISKDPSTKCGAVIVRPDRTVVSQGFNGFPKQLKDNPGEYANRDIKYDKIVHCEMNALIHARTDVTGYTLYTTPSLSCSRCCVHMIQAGITRLVGPYPHGDFGSRWADAVKKTRAYCLEGGIAYTEIDIDTWEVVTNYNPEGYR